MLKYSNKTRIRIILIKLKEYHKYHKCKFIVYVNCPLSISSSLNPILPWNICNYGMVMLTGSFSRDYLPFLQLHWDTADYWFL